MPITLSFPKLTFDGVLQITYSSLIDVRVVKLGNLDTAKAVIGEVNEVPVCNQTPISGSNVMNNTQEILAPEPAHGIYCRMFPF